MKLVDSAMEYVAPAPDKPGQFAFIAPYIGQAKKIAWNLLVAKCSLIKGTVIDKSELTITLPNRNVIWIGGADNPKSIRGTYLNGVVLDEVADIKPSVWFEVIYPMLQDYDGWAILQGTPKGINLLSEIYYKHLQDPSWSCQRFTVHDTDVFTKAQIDGFKRNMSEAAFAQEWLCDFSAGNNTSLLTVYQVEESVGRMLNFDDYKLSPRTIGVDVARQGDDSTVIIGAQGLMMSDPIAYQGLDSMAVASRVAEYQSTYKAQTIFIDDTGGFGSGVIDRLRQLGYNNVVGVNSSHSPDDEHYANKRAEMYFRLRDWVLSGGKLPNNMRLKSDLTATRYTHKNSKGKTQLISKDKIKEELLFSPDFGDAAALNFAAKIFTPEPIDAYSELTGNTGTVDSEWKNPWD